MSADYVEFGPFRLMAAERRLFMGERVVHIGGRALDILITLVERPGEVVTKRELYERVWPGVVVEESSLRVQVAALRKALADGRGEARYIVNVAGRGYAFVAPLAGAPPPSRSRSGVLPRHPARIIGRDTDIDTVGALLADTRFVTIHGPGGVGKTTLGLAVAAAKSRMATDGFCFVDLSLNTSILTAADALASALGLIVRANDPTANVLSFVGNRTMVLVLDSCEATIDAVAALAERIVHEAPGVSILATSREPLRARGEHVYPLASLTAPPEGVAKASELPAFPAAELFCERAAESGYRAALDDADAAIVGEICRRVDGNPLALELAASRVSTYGLRQTADLLHSHMRLAWRGRRTAPPRHQTLKAMLDWSYALIDEAERALLRRLSVFVGAFSLDEAHGVAGGEGEFVQTLELLVLKSLVATDASIEPRRYRLLDATREYARTKLVESGAAADTSRRHALYYRDRLDRSVANQISEEISDQIPNVRAALDWAFSSGGDPEIALGLATGACELYLRLGMLTESRHWSELALKTLPSDRDGSREHMVLRAAHAFATMFSGGDMKAVRDAFVQALGIAERLDDPAHQFRMLSGLHMYNRRVGAVDELLPIAQRAAAIAPALDDASATAAVHAMLGVSHHMTGNLADAYTALIALRDSSADPGAVMNHYGFHRDAYALIAATLWMRGYPDQAAQAAHTAAGVDEDKDPVTGCLCLMWRVVVFHLSGDWPVAREYVERLVRLAGEHGLAPHKWFGVGLRGDIRIQCGQVEDGVADLRESLKRLKDGGYVVWTPWLACCLAEALAMRGDVDQARSLLADLDPGLADANLYMPEFQRVRGAVMAQAGETSAAERVFLESLDLADVRGSLSWRLRAATSLARLRLKQGRRHEARQPLAETYGRFTEGFDTLDLRAARAVIAEIDAANPRI